MMYLMVAAGLVLLLAGGEALVRAAVSLAARLGVSQLVIAMTVVAFGTSAPELVVSVGAVFNGSPDLALGNVVGSNIANILLVVAVTAIIAPIACDRAMLGREGIAMMLASVAFVGLVLTGTISFWAGAVMVAMLTGLLVLTYRASMGAKADNLSSEAVPAEGFMSSPLMALLLLVGGIAGLVVGAQLLVDGAQQVARAAGLSETVIGITLVAVGTSLPELATSVVAAFRKHGDVAIGNAVGSNLFNILFVLGLSSMVGDIPVPDQVARFDIWVVLGAAVILLPLALLKKHIGRLMGLLMLVLYAAYVAAQLGGTV